MVTNHSPKRLLESAALVAAGVIVGIVLYVWLVLMLALAGFYTVSFGTAAFVALFVSAVFVVTSVVTGRRSGAGDPRVFQRRLSLFLRAMLVTHVVLCAFSVVFMPETVLFLSRG